ncbi:MAG: hypothetical protein WC322_03755 [Candidatus Paceibacterota bacterium]|jgi:hypothetical protein|nr:hypothetical protein [Candidatus Paceibacterota bacterium]
MCVYGGPENRPKGKHLCAKGRQKRGLALSDGPDALNEGERRKRKEEE